MSESMDSRWWPALGLSDVDAAALVPHRPILVAYRGSIAHGTHVPPEDPDGVDDVDLHALYIPGLEEYFGVRDQPPKGRDIKVREFDCAAYELRKAVGLLVRGNPNIISALWTRPEHVLMASTEGEMLVEARELFVSRACYHAFVGYAYGQLTRMTSWHKEQDSPCGCRGEHHEQSCAVNLERGRGSSKRFATGFMGAKRKALAERYGYDTKNAAHLLRLLAMGRELMEEGVVRVDRTGIDAEFLKQVKRGGLSLREVQREAGAGFDALKEAMRKSAIPEAPDARRVGRLVKELLCLAHHTEVACCFTEVARARWEEMEARRGR